MLKILPSLIFLMFGCMAPLLSKAQSTTALPTAGGTSPQPVKPHQYYLLIDGVQSPEDWTAIEQRVKGRPGILQFTVDDLPVSYFIIRSEVRITAADFRQWIQGLPYTLKQMEGDDPLRTEQMLTPIIRKKRGGR